MARKPNYRFERFERDRAKAAKKAAKAEARALRKAGNAKDDGASSDTAEEAGAVENAESGQDNTGETQG